MKQKEPAKTSRIATIDILRGFFIFSIIVVHLARFPSGYDVLTGRGILWVTNSEGFFLMSGMLIGMVRGRKAIKVPFAEVAKKLLRRGAMLYVWTIGLTILFTYIALQSGLPSVKAGVWQGAVTSQFFIETLSFGYVYSWADFLQYYSIYLFRYRLFIYCGKVSGGWLSA